MSQKCKCAFLLPRGLHAFISQKSPYKHWFGNIWYFFEKSAIIFGKLKKFIPIPHIPSEAELRFLLACAREEGASEKVIGRIQMLCSFVENNLSVSHVCAETGCTRSTFYRTLERVDIQNWRTLLDESRRPKHTRCSQLSTEAMALIRQYRMSMPHAGKQVIARLLAEKHGETVSVSAVGRLIAKENLYFGDSVMHQRKRAHTKTHTPSVPQQDITGTNAEELTLPTKTVSFSFAKGMLAVTFCALLLLGGLFFVSKKERLDIRHAAAPKEVSHPTTFDSDDLTLPALQEFSAMEKATRSPLSRT